MWFDLYLAIAALSAIAIWLVSPRFPSYDPPGAITRACWSVAAGALWPLMVIGAAQTVAFRHLTRRMRPADCEEVELPQLVTVGAGPRF